MQTKVANGSKLTYKNLFCCVNLTSWTAVKQTLKRNSLLFTEYTDTYSQATLKELDHVMHGAVELQAILGTVSVSTEPSAQHFSKRRLKALAQRKRTSASPFYWREVYIQERLQICNRAQHTHRQPDLFYFFFIIEMRPAPPFYYCN